MTPVALTWFQRAMIEVMAWAITLVLVMVVLCGLAALVAHRPAVTSAPALPRLIVTKAARLEVPPDLGELDVPGAYAETHGQEATK